MNNNEILRCLECKKEYTLENDIYYCHNCGLCFVDSKATEIIEQKIKDTKAKISELCESGNLPKYDPRSNNEEYNRISGLFNEFRIETQIIDRSRGNNPKIKSRDSRNLSKAFYDITKIIKEIDKLTFER